MICGINDVYRHSGNIVRLWLTLSPDDGRRRDEPEEGGQTTQAVGTARVALQCRSKVKVKVKDVTTNQQNNL